MSESKREPTELKEKITKSIPVSAKYCLWFAWAPENEPGPEGEVVNDTYRPREIIVAGIKKLRVTAVPTDMWSHHPGKDSDAGGIDDTRDLENAAYKNDQYQSKNIKTLDARLNLLVGLLGGENAPASEVKQIKIGLQADIDIDDAAATRLFLGFHDGRHWTNNEGTVHVSIEILETRP